MEKVMSKDGTPIAYERSGNGPALILLHGSNADHRRWTHLLPAFEQHFTVYAVDRRGRGESGDSNTYAIEREFEDVVALIEAIGEPVKLLGHSYGAIGALEAARLSQNIHKIVSYEASIRTGSPISPPGLIERIQALLAKGEREEALITFMREVIRRPPAEIEFMRSQPFWPNRIAAAHTLPRELQAIEDYTFKPEEFKAVTIPILLMQGEVSPPPMKAADELVSGAFSNHQLTVMPGQGHIALDVAPDLFLREVLTFLVE